MSTKRVILWTAPRCVSTAFERSIRNLGNSKVFHEPFQRPYYLGPERQSNRLSDRPVNPHSTYESVCAMLQKDYSGMDLVYSKDMAYYTYKRFDLFLEEGFKHFQHSFLIRDPRKAVPSQYRGSINPEMTGWNDFDPDDAGFKELFELFRFVQEHLDASPVVVDAVDLLENPEGIMRSYCGALGLKYQANMTKWSPGPVADFDCTVWSGWHADVFKSSGITQRKRQTQAVNEHMPVEVEQAIAECTPYYEAMYESRIHAME